MYMYSNGLTWHLYLLCTCTGRKVYQAACEVPAYIYAERAMALCSLWAINLINAKFICNTVHIQMGQHVLKTLH